MVWEQLRGHAGKAEMFRRSVGRGRLSHAWLFSGPAGTGRRLFARLLAQCLFCTEIEDSLLEACGYCHNCRQMQAGSHPDLLEIGRPPDKTGIPVELLAGSVERRGREGLCYELSLRPMSASRRIAVIDDAELMAAESANSLLKTLEEPPDRCLLILLTTSTDVMLPTIRSRCQTMRFEPLAEKDVADLLLLHEFVSSPEEAATAAKLSDGSLETARELLEPEIAAMQDELFRLLSARPMNSRNLAAAMIEMLGRAGTEASAQRAAGRWMLKFAGEFYRQLLRCLSDEQYSCPEAVRRFSGSLPAEAATFDILAECLDRLSVSVWHLQTNSPVGVCLESLAEDLGRLLRPLHRRQPSS